MAEGKSESKINYEQIADMGSGLIIAKVPSVCIREQDINARIMKNEMQRQLTDNIRKRGQLESLPFCVLAEDRNQIEIISGHHRIRSGKDAGLKEFFVILDISGLNRSKIVAKQIAHNAISGFDDIISNAICPPRERPYNNCNFFAGLFPIYLIICSAR